MNQPVADLGETPRTSSPAPSTDKVTPADRTEPAETAAASAPPESPVAASAEPPRPVDPALAATRRAVLLYQLLDAGEEKLKQGDANRKLGLALKEALSLTNEEANRLREQLIQEGLVEAVEQGRTVAYGLTERGREYVRTLERPTLTATPVQRTVTPVDESAVPEETRRARRAFLLYQLHDTEGQKLSQGDSNHSISRTARKELGLSNEAANWVRAELVGQGDLLETPAGKTVVYTLTEKGRQRLSTMERPALLSGTGRRLVKPVDESDVSDQVRRDRRAYLLYQLSDAEEQKLSQGDANHGIPRSVRTVLGLSNEVANWVRAELVEQGLVAETPAGKSVIYALNDKGREQLATLARPTIRPAEPVIDETAIPEELRSSQKTYLLLQLFLGEGQKRAQSELQADLNRRVRETFALTPQLVKHRLEGLAQQGFVRQTEAGDIRQYELTEDGRDYLLSETQHEEFTFSLTGKQLNALLGAVRATMAEQGMPQTRRPERTATTATQTPAEEAVARR
jgi:predicted transcriptional regulator